MTANLGRNRRVDKRQQRITIMLFYLTISACVIVAELAQCYDRHALCYSHV